MPLPYLDPPNVRTATLKKMIFKNKKLNTSCRFVNHNIPLGSLELKPSCPQTT